MLVLCPQNIEESTFFHAQKCLTFIYKNLFIFFPQREKCIQPFVHKMKSATVNLVHDMNHPFLFSVQERDTVCYTWRPRSWKHTDFLFKIDLETQSFLLFDQPPTLVCHLSLVKSLIAD